MIVLGLTGSIGMGKTTTAAMFAEAGAPVWDADAAVHALYAPGGAAVRPVAEGFPGVVVDGAIDRARLADQVVADPASLGRLEAIVHPLVAVERERFLADARAAGASAVVLSIPLLYETGGERETDAVVVVTATQAVQRARVLARPGMDAAKLDALLARQLPDAEKRARAEFVIDTGQGLEHARAAVRDILATVRDAAWRSQKPAASARSDALDGPPEPPHAPPNVT